MQMAKRFILIIGLASLCMSGLTGCGNNNHSNSQQAEPLTASPQVIGLSTEANETANDGEWMVWTDRPVSLMLSDGTDTVDLSSIIDPSLKLVANDNALLQFDGQSGIFVADDILDAKGLQIFYISSATAEPALVQVTDFSVDEEGLGTSEPHVAFKDGLIMWAWVDADGTYHGSYYDTDAEAPEIIEANVPVETEIVSTSKMLFWIGDDNRIYYIDTMAPDEPLSITTDNAKDSLVANDGLVAWVEENTVYYVSTDDLDNVRQASDAVETDYKDHVVVGNGYVAWTTSPTGGIYGIGYHDITDEDGVAHSVVSPVDVRDLSIGDGVFAWTGNGSYPDTYPVYAYTIGDEGIVLLGSNETYNSSDLDNDESYFNGLVQVSGTVVYWATDYRESDPFVYRDPSMYIMKYDTASDEEASKLSTTDYQRIFSPAVADGKIAWISKSANFSIYAAMVDDPLTTITVTPADMTAHLPAIDNGILVFNGYDRSQMTEVDGDNYLGDEDLYREIYSCDLNSETRDLVNISNNESPDEKPLINGDIIAWKTDNYSDAEDNYIYSAAYYYDRLTEEVTQLTSYGEINHISNAVHVTGNYVYWRDNSDIYLHDTSDDTGTILTTSAYIQRCPVLAGDILTWVSSGSVSGYSIYYFDMANLTAETPEDHIVELAAADESDQRPATDGRFITWGGSDRGGDYSVYYIDLQADTPATMIIGGELGDGEIYSEVCNPRIDNGLVVFAAEAYKDLGEEDGDKELFYFDLLAETPTLTQLTDNDLWDSRPELKDNVITWRTGGSSYWDWYGKMTAAALLER